MRQKIKFVITLVLIVLVIGMISISSGTRRSYLDYPKSLEQTAVVVDGKALTLEDMAFYVVYEERLVEEEAFLYDPENTGNYWRIHANGTYVRTEAKDAAMKMAIHDEIFFRLAEKAELELDPAEEQYLANTQMDFWSDIEDGTLEKLGVSEQTLNDAMGKIALAEKYQDLLAQTGEKKFEAYSVDGEAYGELLSEHQYEIKEEVWERVHFGSITVAH